ncbi:MAG: hypothetical protein GEU86_12935 [Actinophytocola sp.]|nr:hypothetical protein [Actinophytocola sp.]
MKQASVPASPEVRSLIDEPFEVDDFSPDGIDRRTAHRLQWQSAERARNNPSPEPTSWLGMSEEERERIRSRRRPLRVVTQTTTADQTAENTEREAA